MLSKLQDKNRMYRKLAENAEEMATSNLARLRRAQVHIISDYLHIISWVFTGRSRDG